MVPGLGVERIGKQRRGGDELAHVGILAVENTQRVALEAPLAVFVEPVLVRREILDELALVFDPGLRGAERIDLQRRALDAERLPQPRRDDDQLGVDLGVAVTQRLDVQLMELSVAALLRPLVAKHRARAPELLLLIVQQSVAQTCPDDARRRLGPHRDLIAVAILKGIHLLLDDIGRLTDRAAEELGPFEHRKPNLTVAVTIEELRSAGLDTLPVGCVRRQDVVHAPHGLDDFHET